MGTAPLAEKKTLNDGPTGLSSTPARPAVAPQAALPSAAGAQAAAAPRAPNATSVAVPAAPRVVQPWEDHPAPPIQATAAPVPTALADADANRQTLAPAASAGQAAVPMPTLPHVGGAGKASVSAGVSTSESGIASVPAETPASPAGAIYSESGALPPGQILPVRATQPWNDETDDAPDAAPEDDYDLDEASAAPVPRAPAPAVAAVAVDHRVVGVPVRQQAESRADASAAAQAAVVLLPTEEGDFWHATVQALVDAQAIGAMVRELALQSQLVARDEGQWMLRVERESLNQPGSRDRLTQALKDAGFDVLLAVEVGRVTDSPGRRNAQASAERQVAAEQLIYATPLVQTLMKDFGARVVPGSIRPL